MTIENIYKLFVSCKNVCTDTRNILKDSLFISLKGNSFDGNKFAQEAINKGSKFALVENKIYANNTNIFYVPNTLIALQNLANYHRNNFKIPIIGITGTNGKTTTKELISAVLQKKYNVTYTKGNFNNHIGVPLTLLEINDSTEIAIIEMGANHIGEIKSLCEIANPNYGIITNVGKAHIEGFGSIDGVLKTKTEMYRFLELKNGQIFINADNEMLIKNKNNLQFVDYGTNENYFVSGKNQISNPFLKLEWKTKENSNWNKLQTNLVGKYNYENVLAAICIGKHFNVNSEKINDAISKYVPTNNRSQIIKSEKNNLLIDAYNANPTSMNAALDNFFEMNAENKVLIIGDMLELGNDSELEHKIIYNKIQNSGVKEVYLVGKTLCKISESKTFKTFENITEILLYFKNNPISNKNILIKGSHGIHLEKLIEVL